MSKKNLTTRETILNLTAELKKSFVKKTELTPIQALAASAFHSAKVDGNTVNFYASADKTGDAAFTMDFPVDMVLDQAKTAFVDKFAFSAETYPGATDPNLNNKPVMVLAVKGEGDTVSYSFLNMAKLVDTYKAKVEGKDASTTVTVEGYEIDVAVNISAEAGNLIEKKADGLYVGAPNISGKADKVTGATEGNLAALDANGNLTDSGVAGAEVLTSADIADYTAEEIAALLADAE